MPAARKRRLWDPQQVPNCPIEVNWGHPLSDGMIGFWPLNGTLNDLVAGNNLSTSSIRTFGTCGVGPAWQSASTTVTPANVSFVAPVVGSGACSTFLQFATVSTTGASTNFAAFWGASTTGNQFALSVESGVLWSRNWSNSANGGSGFNDGKIHSYGWSKPASGTAASIGIYGDGKSLSTTTSGTTVLSFASTDPLYLGSVNSGGAFVGSLSGFRVWSRQLSAAEFEWLNAEPWAMVQRIPRRTYSIISSGSGAALAAAAADATFASGALTTAIQMLAAASDTTSASAVLTTAIQLAAAAQDVTSAAGQLSTAITLAANAADATTAAGLLTTQIQLDAAASDAPAATGALTTALQLASAASAATSATGSLAGAGGAALAANAADTTSAAGALTTAVQLGAAASDVTQATGALLTQILLAAHALDAVTAAADLSTRIALKGDGLDTTIATGILSTSIQLSGAAQDLSSATGALQTAIELASAALDVTTAQATLGVGTMTIDVLMITAPPLNRIFRPGDSSFRTIRAGYPRNRTLRPR